MKAKILSLALISLIALSMFSSFVYAEGAYADEQPSMFSFFKKIFNVVGNFMIVSAPAPPSSCGDGICTSNENHANCPQDCKVACDSSSINSDCTAGKTYTTPTFSKSSGTATKATPVAATPVAGGATVKEPSAVLVNCGSSLANSFNPECDCGSNQIKVDNFVFGFRYFKCRQEGKTDLND